MGASPVEHRAWRCALGAYEAAKRASDRACASFIGRTTDRLGEGQRVDAIVDAMFDAEKVMMQTPAPDLAGLLVKLEILLEQDEDGGTAGYENGYASQALVDARRLAGAS